MAFRRKKEKISGQSTETTPAPQAESDKPRGAEVVQFEKNIKTLWIYTTLFCLFALALIVISSVIQGRINSKAEYYQDRYEDAQTSNRSTIKNIQDENAALKRDLEAAQAESKELTAAAETDGELIGGAAGALENAEYIASAQRLLLSGDRQGAKIELDKVDANSLSNPLRDIYLDIQQRLQ